MNKAFRSVAYMFLISLVFTALVSAVKVTQDDRIAHNRAVKLQRVILKVLNLPLKKGMSDGEAQHLFDRRVRPLEVRGRTMYVGYEADGRTIKGYVFPVGGPGFWGPIFGMAAVTPDAGQVLGLAFYKHSETPGLGARISEPWFTDQFKGLPLQSRAAGQKFFYLKPAGTSRAADELDAVTGATRTSAAVETFLNREFERFLKNDWSVLAREQGGHGQTTVK